MNEPPSRTLRWSIALSGMTLGALNFWLAWSGSAAFARMFVDFGSYLPAITAFALTWGRWLMSFVALGGAGVAIRTALRGRVSWPGEAAVVVEVAALGLFLLAMYVPATGLPDGNW